ncbi:MAG: type II toxin-antitoxin system RelE/ParE family toxin [Flavobacteriales bacterium]|nr:MAG: type II toxin-antitoxin system RelE/ParE family toxin [Flavobacteriales bacterium]
MSLRPVFRPAAREDVAEGYAWYEARREGLGDAFLLEVQRCLAVVLRTPSAFRKVHKEFRQALMDRFPYVIVYRVADEHVVVMRVFHCSQHPAKKFRKKRK